MSQNVTYHGAEAVEQPTLQLWWEPGESKELDDETAARLCTPGALFTGPEGAGSVQPAPPASTPVPTATPDAAPAPIYDPAFAALAPTPAPAPEAVPAAPGVPPPPPSVPGGIAP